MSEERILRLENAMATLAEISAQHNERLAAIERTTQSLERTTQSLERATQSLESTTQTFGHSIQTLIELAANQQRRVTRLEESYVRVVELLRSHHDGITELRAAQAEADARVAALADAQIRAEATQERADERLRAALAQLAESQAHTDRRLDALIDVVRGGRGGPSES